MPPLLVILQTYQRTEYAQRTVGSFLKHVGYDGIIDWYIADDGSPEAHFETLFTMLEALPYHPSVENIYGHNERLGPGKSFNRAWEFAKRQNYALTFWLEDDWVCERPLDLTPYARLLLENERMGMVRLGHIPINLDLFSFGYNGRMYLKVGKDKQYTFSGNPHLCHYRFYESYGKYPEGLNPGDTELAYDHRIRSLTGPDIVFPLEVGERPFFGHIGQVQSYEA